MASFLSTPLIEIENAIAADAAFRTWCGATDAADAKANYIFSDDSVDEDDLPAKYAAVSEMEDWRLPRNAEGAGRGSFNFVGGVFGVVFSEEVGATVASYTATNRIAFKDTVAGFIDAIITNYEGLGQRISSVSKIPFSESFPFRGQLSDDGNYVYQYGIMIDTGVEL